MRIAIQKYQVTTRELTLLRTPQTCKEEECHPRLSPLHPKLESPGWTCVSFTFSFSRMTIVKASSSYFACASPATTPENLSSDWFMPST
jgi:hypothetical protein